MRRRPPLADDTQRSPLPPVATGVALGIWIAVMLVLAFVVVPLLFGTCTLPQSGPAP
jgi:hypothetical protein